MIQAKDKISSPLSRALWKLTPVEIFENLQTSPEGLSQEEAKKRLKIWNSKNKKLSKP